MKNYIKNPDAYHGKKKKSNFFEGWYFKLVQPYTGYTYSFIPGIFISDKEEESHSFIQILKGDESNYNYLRFNKGLFNASTAELNLKVHNSFFSLREMKLEISQQSEEIYGTLHFNNIIKWPDSVINPGSMGFYNYLGFMQCYSQVCAIDGEISGELFINGKRLDFTGGKLYVEKNWGRSFPNSYIWVQGNSFENEEGSVTCSIGSIPLPFRSFTGFLIGIYARKNFYKFTSINKSTLSISCKDEKIILEAYNKEYFLKIEGCYSKDRFMNLYAPYEGNMVPIANETLCGSLKVLLYDNKKNSLIFNDSCSSAGIEFSQNYKDLILKL